MVFEQGIDHVKLHCLSLDRVLSDQEEVVGTTGVHETILRLWLVRGFLRALTSQVLMGAIVDEGALAGQ